MIKILDRKMEDDFQFVLDTVAKESKEDPNDIRSFKRDENLVTARKVLHCLLRRRGYKLKDIASITKNTHAVVSVNTNAFIDLYTYDKNFNKLYDVCLSKYNLMVTCDENSILLDESIRIQNELEQFNARLKSLKQKLINNQNKLECQKKSM
tara:strand:- start:219 stop:674 length:456 start_codon:yes stop_codon:yes gene_type:complete